MLGTVVAPLLARKLTPKPITVYLIIHLQGVSWHSRCAEAYFADSPELNSHSGLCSPCGLRLTFAEQLLPLIIGAVCQVIMQRYCTRIFSQGQKIFKLAFQLMLVVLIYCLFSKCFKGGMHGLNLSEFVVMTIFVSAVHMVAVCCTWIASSPLCLPQRIALVFVAPQKSEGMAVPIIAAIANANDTGLYMLPVVVYHTVQMILASILTEPLRRRMECWESNNTIEKGQLSTAPLQADLLRPEERSTEHDKADKGAYQHIPCSSSVGPGAEEVLPRSALPH